MDSLTCRSPSRCATCAHFEGNVCLLEEALNEALAPRPVVTAQPRLLLVDARRVAAAALT